MAELLMKYGPYPKRHRPGSQWRTLAYGWNGRGQMMHPEIADDSDNHDSSVFDEVVIDAWFHLEQMSERGYLMALTREDGSRLVINVWVGERGLAASAESHEEPA